MAILSLNEFNKDTIAFILFCDVYNIPTYLTTSINPIRSAKEMTTLDYKDRTIQYSLDQFKLYDIKKPTVVTFYDPVEKNYYLKMLASEKQIFKLMPQIAEEINPLIESKIIENNSCNVADIAPGLIENNPKFTAFYIKQEEECARLEKSSKLKNYKDLNGFQLLQLQYIYNIFREKNPDVKIVHVSRLNIINPLLGLQKKEISKESRKKELIVEDLNAKELPPVLSFLKKNVLPVHFAADDKTNAWQKIVAQELGLDQMADLVLNAKADLDSVGNDDRGRLAILLYLHQNKVAFGLQTLELQRLENITKEFVRKVNLNGTLKISDELRRFAQDQLGFKFCEPIFILAEDFDGNLICPSNVEAAYGETPLQKINERKYCLHLWAKTHSQNIKIVINTHRTLKEYANLLLAIDFPHQTVTYFSKKYQELGIDIDKIVTAFDPIEENYFKKILALEKGIEEGKPPSFLIEKIGIFPQMVFPNVPQSKEEVAKWTRTVDAMLSNPNYQKFFAVTKDESIAKQNSLFNGKKYLDTNRLKEAQLRHIFEYYKEKFPNKEIVIVFTDDSKDLIQGLENLKKNELTAESAFLSNVFPIHFDQKNDVGHKWQQIVADKIGLKDAAEQIFYNQKKLNEVAENDFARLALLLYLHENLQCYLIGNKEINNRRQWRLQKITNEFAQKVKKENTLKLSLELLEYAKILGMDLSPQTPVQPTVNWLNIFANFWQQDILGQIQSSDSKDSFEVPITLRKINPKIWSQGVRLSSEEKTIIITNIQFKDKANQIRDYLPNHGVLDTVSIETLYNSTTKIYSVQIVAKSAEVANEIKVFLADSIDSNNQKKITENIERIHNEQATKQKATM